MPADRPPTARDALGMPVPPAWAARAATTARAGVGRLHDRMVPPFNLVMDRLFGMVDAKAIHTAVVLEIPDRLADGPRRAAELATDGELDPDALDRLLRFLVSRGLFRVDPAGRFSNNAASEVLRRDHPWSWRDWAIFLGADWSWELWNRLPERVRTGEPASDLSFGQPFFDYVNATNTAAGDAFNGAMAAGSRVQALLFAEAVDLRDARSICDVGGGTGSVLAHVLRSHPHLEGVVFDLPALADEADAVLSASNLGARAMFEAGDFFESVPGGHDAYLLFAVVHDWDDDDAVRILHNVRQAMPTHARILVVERPLPDGTRTDFARYTDMLMLVYADGGRERTADEYEVLAQRAGLRVTARTTLASLFEVFELRR